MAAKEDYDMLKTQFQTMHKRAESEYLQLMKVIDRAFEGKNEFPTRDEVEEVNAVIMQRQHALNILADYIHTHGKPDYEIV